MTHHYPKPGDKAPDFELPAAGDTKIRLSDYLHRKNVILSFHPLAFTGVCSAQMQDLQAESGTLNGKETVALGISVDSVPAKKAWADSLGVTDVLFLSDFEPKGRVARLYRVYREKEGFSERAVFIIDKEGIVRFSRLYPIKERPDIREIITAIP